MKILIRPLRDGVLKEVHDEYDPKKLDIEFVDLTYLEDVKLDGTAEKFGDTLTLRAHLLSRLEHTCARCLKSVEETIDQPIEMIYDIKGKEEVDPLEDIRDTLILNHPIRFLCQEDCPGLCPNCGADFNQGHNAGCPGSN